MHKHRRQKIRHDGKLAQAYQQGQRLSPTGHTCSTSQPSRTLPCCTQSSTTTGLWFLTTHKTSCFEVAHANHKQTSYNLQNRRNPYYVHAGKRSQQACATYLTSQHIVQQTYIHNSQHQISRELAYPLQLATVHVYLNYVRPAQLALTLPTSPFECTWVIHRKIEEVRKAVHNARNNMKA